MALTREQFNDEIDVFVDDVVCAATVVYSDFEIDVAKEAEERLRAVVDLKVPLRGPGDGPAEGLAVLTANYKLCVDSYGTHIAVEHSSFVLKAKVDRTPIIRWDYDRSPNNKPRSHAQITAHRGALSHILSRLDHKDAAQH